MFCVFYVLYQSVNQALLIYTVLLYCAVTFCFILYYAVTDMEGWALTTMLIELMNSIKKLNSKNTESKTESSFSNGKIKRTNFLWKLYFPLFSCCNFFLKSTRTKKLIIVDFEIINCLPVPLTLSHMTGLKMFSSRFLIWNTKQRHFVPFTHIASCKLNIESFSIPESSFYRW